MAELADQSTTSPRTGLPAEPIDRLVSPLVRFLHVETASGIFIADLALAGPLLDTAKIGVLTVSVLSAVAGMAVLLFALPTSPPTGVGLVER